MGVPAKWDEIRWLRDADDRSGGMRRLDSTIEGRGSQRMTATGDPASAELARRRMRLSRSDELRQLIAELKYPELKRRRRIELLESMESILTDADLGNEMQEGSS